jgi:hypothetical protein
MRLWLTIPEFQQFASGGSILYATIVCLIPGINILFMAAMLITWLFMGKLTHRFISWRPFKKKQ